MRTEAQRRADAAYRKNRADDKRKKYALVGAEVPREIAERFSAACAERGTTKNAVIRAAVEKFIQENK